MKISYSDMRNLVRYETEQFVGYIRASSIVAYGYDKQADITHVLVGGLPAERAEFVFEGDQREALASAVLSDEAKRTTHHA